MRLEDAPPPGWYPDPAGTSRLRWWEGTDWSDRYRARPIQASVTAEAVDIAVAQRRPDIPTGAGNPAFDNDALAEYIRLAVRQESDRVATVVREQARSAAAGLSPLISEYTSKVVRWFRIAATLTIVLLIAWIAFQTIAQVSFFEWLGDRIDNVTDQNGAIVPFR